MIRRKLVHLLIGIALIAIGFTAASIPAAASNPPLSFYPCPSNANSSSQIYSTTFDPVYVGNEGTVNFYGKMTFYDKRCSDFWGVTVYDSFAYQSCLLILPKDGSPGWCAGNPTANLELGMGFPNTPQRVFLNGRLVNSSSNDFYNLGNQIAGPTGYFDTSPGFWGVCVSMDAQDFWYLHDGGSTPNPAYQTQYRNWASHC